MKKLFIMISFIVFCAAQVSAAQDRIIAADMPGLLTMEQEKAVESVNKAAASGFNAVRFLVSFSEDKPYAFQTKPGEFNEPMYKKTDAVMAAISKAGIKAIPVLMDNGSDFGGKEVYSKWADGSHSSVIFRDKISRELFKKYITTFTDRVNTVSGVKYSADSSILAWDLCNGAENPYDADGTVMYAWVNEMASFLKSKAPLQRVMITLKKLKSDEGNINGYDIYMLPVLDYAGLSVTLTGDGNVTTAATQIKEETTVLVKNTGKPVMLVYNCGDKGGKELSSAAEAFFINGGNILASGPAAYGLKKQDSSLMDMDNSVTAAQVIKSAEIMKGAPPAKVITVEIERVTPAEQAAQIEFRLSSEAQTEVIYGESIPLKLSEGNFTGNKGSINLSGLKPETKYYYALRMTSGSASAISAIKSFTTKSVKRLTAKRFMTSNNFITAKDGKFYDGNKVYRYLGTNNYYIRQRDNKFIDSLFEEMANAGFKVVRIGTNGEAESMDKIDKNDIGRYFRIGPDYFNEDAYKRVDYVIDSAKRHGLRVIIHFTDNWEYYGGVKVIAAWAGVSKNAFWTNDRAKELYKQSVDAYCKRKNTVNGIMYKDDPTIFAYDLLNEPRNEDDQTGEVMAEWVDEMSAYVKSVVPKTMVNTGTEGFFAVDGKHYSGTDYIKIHKAKNIDFCTFHIYPAGEYNQFSMSATKWLLEKYIKEGHETLKKPVVMEEYGIPSGLEAYPKAKWIDFMTEAFFNAGGDGANYWFYIDSGYEYGDGNEISLKVPEQLNAIIKNANTVN